MPVTIPLFAELSLPHLPMKRQPADHMARGIGSIEAGPHATDVRDGEIIEAERRAVVFVFAEQCHMFGQDVSNSCQRIDPQHRTLGIAELIETLAKNAPNPAPA